MSDLENAAALLRMAEKDLMAVEGMGDPATFAEEIFGFHVQQAAEKALKAWLAAVGEEYPLTHNLATLLDILSGFGVDVEGFWELVDYNPFGVQFRYETLDETDEPVDRRAAAAHVRRLLEHVRGVIAVAVPSF